MFAILLAAAVAAADAPPAAAPAAASPAAAPEAAKPEGQKLVCWMEAPSGSHQKQKLCATQAQLDHLKRNADDYLSQRKTEAIKPFGQ
jgi:predicted secreted protein